MRFEWSVYNRGDSLQARTWHEQRSPAPNIGNYGNFAIRFKLPASYDGAAGDVNSYYGVNRTEILVDGTRIYEYGFDGRYQAPGVSAIQWSRSEVGIRFPSSGTYREIEIRWSFIHRSALSRLWRSGSSVDPTLQVIPADVLFRGMAITPHPILRNLSSLFLLFMSIVSVIAGLSRGGAGRQPFIILSLFAISGAVASSSNIANVFGALPVLRWTPGAIVSAFSTLCLLVLGPLLVVFHRASTIHAANRSTIVATRFVVGIATSALVLNIALAMIPGISIDLSIILVAAVNSVSGIPIILHARSSDEPEINRAFLVFAVLFIAYVIFAVSAGFSTMFEIDAKLFYVLTTVCVGLVFLPLTAVPLLVYRRVERELLDANVVFRRFVPNEFLGYLGVKRLTDIRPGRQIEVILTVMFCDIRSFTSLAEKMQPPDVMIFINKYLEFAGPVIRECGGFVDKYLGDGVLAVFPGDESDGIRAAIRIATGLPEVDLGRDANAGIGLHRGPAMLGTVGEHNRLDTTVLSDSVNVASRLQGLSAAYGTGILASEKAIGSKPIDGCYASSSEFGGATRSF